jgi:hypothetical protein
MTDPHKLHGAVIIPYDKPYAHEVVELLTLRLRDRFEPVFYTHATELGSTSHPDFIMVLSRKSLEHIIEVHRSREQPVPLVIYIDSPEVINAINYDALFPDVEIVAIEQADFSGDPDVTLKIMVFKEIIETLEKRQRIGRRRFM